MLSLPEGKHEIDLMIVA